MKTTTVRLNNTPVILSIVIIYLHLLAATNSIEPVESAVDYYYTRTREHPNHLRISEDFKNNYVDDIQHESYINGTKWVYYKAHQVFPSTYDELVFETIDKIFRHRLSPFYIHHYDNDEDKRQSSDFRIVSKQMCARDLLYLVDKLHHSSSSSSKSTTTTTSDKFYNQKHQPETISPELGAFFDSYARPEAGILMGNTYWVGAYEQCVTRHIFDLVDATGNRQPHKQSASSAAASQQLVGGAMSPKATAATEHKQQVVSFKGRYCVASIKSPKWDKMIEQRKQKSANYFKTKQQYDDYSKLFRLQLGICLPDSCDSSSLSRHQEELSMLTKYALDSMSDRFADYTLNDLYCLPDETSPLRQWSSSAIGFLVLVGLWMLSVFLATLADICEFVNLSSTSDEETLEAKQQQQKVTNSDKRNANRTSKTTTKLVGWLSLRANYRKLMHVSSNETTAAQPAPSEKRTGASSSNTSSCSDTSSSSTAASAANTSSSSGDDDESLTADNTSNVQSERRTKQHQAHDPADSQQQQQQHADNQEVQVNLRFLNAFKVMIMFWIVNGHIMLLMIQTAKNILDSDALLNGLMHFLIGATFGVDLFFTMTGFLTAYLLFNSGHALKMKPATWLYLTFHRYWRLAPMYLLAFWFSRSVMQLLGSGPLWDYGTSALTYRGLCNQESWWYPLTLTSNLHGLFEECMITSWYISCDMQFWLVSPIFLHLLAHHPKGGWLVSLATIAASSHTRYQSILSESAARYDELVQPRADIFMRVSHDLPALYTHPHHRISAYIVGLLAGHYVYMIKSGAWRSSLIYFGASTTTVGVEATTNSNSKAVISSNQSVQQQQQDRHQPKVAATYGQQRLAQQRKNLLAYVGLVLFLLMAFVSYLLSHYFPTNWLKYAREISAYAYAVDHLMMSFGASLVIVAMCLGQWPTLVRWLSHPNWTRLSKINYALLLLQCEAIYFQIFRFEQVPMAGTRELINILFNLLVTLYPLAFVVTLFFEFPLANVEKLLLGGGGGSKKGNKNKAHIQADNKNVAKRVETHQTQNFKED